MVLAFRPLSGFTGLFETELTALLHTRIALEVTFFLERRAEFTIVIDKSTRNSMAQSFCLRGSTAALDGSRDLKLGSGLSEMERCERSGAQGFRFEIILNR